MLKLFISIFFILCGILEANAAPVISAKKLESKFPDMEYVRVHNPIKLDLAVFPIASSKNSTWANPVIPETFILTIPNGQVYSDNGIIIAKGFLVEELIWPWSKLKKDPSQLDIQKLPKPRHISGKVAVIAQEGYRNYYHWMAEILPRLALLEMKGIKYDWLYIPKFQLSFMRETLIMLGIDLNKIIEAEPNTYLEADELIVPSFATKSCYTPKWVADYMREKFLKADKGFKINDNFFSKRIFISRKNAQHRRITNEDEVFQFLKPHGFLRYNLEELSLSQQITLFSNADIIVAPHGAGLVNLLFSKQGTKIIELFQQHEDDTFWYLSQVLKLNHHCIKTTKFRKGGGYTDTAVDLAVLKPVIESLIKENN